MGKKHQRVLEALFSVPPPSSLKWKDVESTLSHLGAHLSEGSGSRVRIELDGEDAVFHRPHPRKEMDKGAIVSLRKFLEGIGIKP